MALRFRNLDIDPDAPVNEWGVEGMLAAIDRGRLSDWRRVARALAVDAEGAMADDLAQALTVAEPSGANALLRLVLERAQEPEAAAVARRVRQAVQRSGLTAAEFATRLGTSASRLSTYSTGKVVPSAVMMERIRRVGRRNVA
jgi:DNA-binding transcriptional regulator YiaG